MSAPTQSAIDLMQAAIYLAPATIQTIGFAAAFCTTTAFIPQLVRVLRLRSARDISLGTFLLFSIGVFLWLVYGLYAHSMPVVVSNGATLVLSLSILILKLKFDGKGRKPDDNAAHPKK